VITKKFPEETMNKLAIAMLLLASPAFAQNKDVAPDAGRQLQAGYARDKPAGDGDPKVGQDPDAGDDPDKSSVGPAGRF
jgi:hypothetical protein